MGAGASTSANKGQFMRSAESGGFFKLIMGAKTNEEKVAAFDKIKEEVTK